MQSKAYILALSMTILGALAVLGGCSKEGPSDSPSASEEVIGFNTSVSWEGTKATAVTSVNDMLANGNIKMYAYLMNAISGTTSGADYFNAQLVPSGSSWNTTPLHYWPYTTLGANPTRSISFFAYQPEGPSVTDFSGASYKTGSASKPSFTYTTPASPADQKDLLTATREFATHEGGTTEGQVDLTFEHALVKLGFVSKISGLANPMPVVVLNSVQVKNVYPTATYTYGTGWGGYTGTRVDYEALTSAFELTTSSQNIMGNGQFMFLIPQSTTDISVDVSYTVDGTAKTSTVSLSGSQAWTPGKGIALELNYKIETNGSITFQLNLIDWVKVAINTEII